ncbi:MAG: membrane protein insertase YidC [Bacteroidales bacterium]|nr:membrane protein insertase YidC [Bacteroidales bacterium]MDD4672763.1 membrane protein insertase YidC [Bacteroidales bacterium]MDY0347781.1 membrane protein insertase YidC [Tenuifilaceae bacterium]
MDRNSVIGLVVIFLILIGFSYLNRPSQEQIEAAQRRKDSIALVQAKQRALLEQEAAFAEKEPAPTTNVEEASLARTDFVDALKGEEQFIILENELIKLKVSTRGGAVYSAEVKNFKTYEQEPLEMLADPQNVFGLQFWANNQSVETRNLFFTPNTSETEIITQEGSSSKSLTMRLAAGESSFIDYIYTIHPNSYLIDFDIQLVNMDRVFPNNTTSIDLIWDVFTKQFEKNAKKESEYSSLVYSLPNGDFEELSPRNEENSKSESTKIRWVGYKQQFFSSFLVSEENFLNANFYTSTILDGEHIKKYASRLAIPIDNAASEKHSMKMYYGPNHFHTLKSYDYGFEEVIPLGGWLIKWINRYVIIFLFNLLNSKIASYGLIIFLMTIIIKVVLLPLTYKSYLSQAKMRVLKPQIDEINKKYPKKDDAMKKQQATMALYKKVGVSPMGGCLPMLIQFPILIAMFRFFPASFELRQKSFLWAEDLSTYDSIIDLPFNIPLYGDHVSLFTLLMAAALFVTSRMNSAQMGDTNAQMPGMKFMTLYMMPVMMLLVFNNHSAALSYYYLLSNVITLGQTLLIRSMVDDESILKKLNENAKKPQAKKKSKFQARLEEMAKQQQQTQKKK